MRTREIKERKRDIAGGERSLGGMMERGRGSGREIEIERGGRGSERMINPLVNENVLNSNM